MDCNTPIHVVVLAGVSEYSCLLISLINCNTFIYVAGVVHEKLCGTQELFSLRDLVFLARNGLLREGRVAMKFSSYLQEFVKLFAIFLVIFEDF